MNAVTQRMLDLPLDIPGTNHERAEAARFIERAILDGASRGWRRCRWGSGRRHGCADYCKGIVATPAQELTRAYGGGFAEKNLRRVMQFAEVFPDEQIVVSAIRQLSWTHIIALLPLKKPLQREFYAEMCRIELFD